MPLFYRAVARKQYYSSTIRFSEIKLCKSNKALIIFKMDANSD